MPQNDHKLSRNQTPSMLQNSFSSSFQSYLLNFYELVCTVGWIPFLSWLVQFQSKICLRITTRHIFLFHKFAYQNFKLRLNWVLNFYSSISCPHISHFISILGKFAVFNTVSGGYSFLDFAAASAQLGAQRAQVETQANPKECQLFNQTQCVHS